MSDKVSAEAVLDAYWDISKRLKAADIWHEGRVYRYDAVSILAQVPGEYWEIDIKDDGTVDFEIYKSKDGVLGGLAELNQEIDRQVELNKE